MIKGHVKILLRSNIANERAVDLPNPEVAPMRLVGVVFEQKRMRPNILACYITSDGMTPGGTS